MNRQEFGRVVAVIRSVYRDKDFLASSESAEVWYELLKDIPYEQAKAAVMKHSLTSKWSPTIAEIRESAVSITEPEKSWSDGWEQVRRAIGRYGYCNEADALESMDDITRTVAKRLGWQTICATELDDIPSLRANFRMIYEQIQEKHSTDDLLPSEMKEQIDSARADKVKQLTTDLADKLGI